jgi:hypothetical protein
MIQDKEGVSIKANIYLTLMMMMFVLRESKKTTLSPVYLEGVGDK